MGWVGQGASGKTDIGVCRRMPHPAPSGGHPWPTPLPPTPGLRERGNHRLGEEPSSPEYSCVARCLRATRSPQLCWNPTHSPMTDPPLLTPSGRKKAVFALAP